MLTEHAAQSWVFTVFVINEKPDAKLSSLTPFTPLTPLTPPKFAYSANGFLAKRGFSFLFVQAVGLFLIRTTEKANLFGFIDERIENV